ncbi:type II toxin-antitoxin system VapC family toxin [Sorangium sp. So ce887]|uniref:type II toxin-antitoxin system VapC family toxin n=1 Tax=Sorangium sp. So ce887 TaxID=3133324 RepID=UPI003F624B58
MKIAFDTSALVAGLHRAHPLHGRAVVWLDAVAEGRVTGLVTWHALAELWSVLTRLPNPARATPEQALQIVGRVRSVFDVRPLDPAVYDEAMKRCTERQFSSGVLFDALHLVAAEQAGADALVTFNGSDFLRLAAASSPRVVIPPDPPELTL